MRTPTISLRTAVILPFMAVLLLTVCVITLIQKHTYQDMIKEISHKQLSSISQNVDSNLSAFLYGPYKVSIALSQSILNDGIYAPENLTPLVNYIRSNYNNLKTHLPQLSLMKFASEKDGSFVGFRADSSHNLSFIKKDQTTYGNMNIYSGETDSTPILATIPNYNPLPRPWYQPTVQAGKTIWSAPYVDQDERQDISLSASTPLYKNNQLIGVFSSDVRLAEFSDFLAEQKKLNNASIFIFDEDHHLIAHSNFHNSIASNQTSNKQPFIHRLTTNSHDPIIKATASQIIEQGIDLTSGSDFTFSLNNERYYSYTIPFRDSNGIKWSIALTTPESALLGTLPTEQHNALWFGLFAGLLASIFGYLVFSRVTRTLNATATAAYKIAEGEWETSSLPKSCYIQETNVLVEAFSSMTHKLKQSFENLREQLIYDSLTQLYTRHGLVEAYNKSTASHSGTLIAIGIARFRDINDSFGHYKGDRALLLVAQYLKDIKEKDHIISRSSGAEFILYIPTQDEDAIETIANKIQGHFKAPQEVGTKQILITPILGIASVNKSENLHDEIKNASIALSYAKKSPEKRVSYSDEMANESGKRMESIADITKAISNDEFIPFYQPIMDVKSGKMIGVEALARWISPTKGLVSPLDFIPTAEEYGLIKHIGYKILLKSCIDTQKAIREGMWDKDFHLHVNISVKQLQQEHFIDDIRDILEQSQLDVKHLTLEVTESNMADADTMVMQNMKAIRALGIGIAIDDFGTGYSSLSYLHKLPFDCLKIDRAFIKDLDTENAPSSIAAIIMGMAQNMSVTVVSEGVETEGQAQILKDLGCQQAQGFLYAKPQPFEEWVKLATNNDCNNHQKKLTTSSQ
ncbi:EAL domain-containing protein [Vibrio rumoiensis]|uniref:EAL domain-containing protein n=1 Tax=Vibrio rumoiensis TaxID=76258 RepID=UPI003AA8E067